MAATIGDYLFWKLATLGARQVLGRGQRTLFIGSIHRNRLTQVDITRYHATSSPAEIGVFVVSSNVNELAICFEEARRYFPGRPVVLVQELSSADVRGAADITAGLSFAAATVINAPVYAASQINQILDAMLHQSKPVYIGIGPAFAGVVIAVPTGSGSIPAGTSRAPGYPVSAAHANAASAAMAMSFLH